MRILVVMMMSMTLDGVIIAVAIPVIAATVVQVLMSALRKWSRIITPHDLLLGKAMDTFFEQSGGVVWLYHWGLSDPTPRFVKTTWS